MKFVVKDRRRICHNLISALEHAEGKTSKDVILKRQVRTIDKNDISKIFGENNDRLSHLLCQRGMMHIFAILTLNSGVYFLCFFIFIHF